MKLRPNKIEITIDGKKPSDWFDSLEKEIEDRRATELGYNTPVRMITGEFLGATGKIKSIRIDSSGSRFEIKFDKQQKYERDYDGWYVTDDTSCKRTDFEVIT